MGIYKDIFTSAAKLIDNGISVYPQPAKLGVVCTEGLNINNRTALLLLLWRGSVQNLRNTNTITVSDKDCNLSAFIAVFHSLMGCKGYIYGDSYDVITSLRCDKYCAIVTSPYLYALYRYVAESVATITETPYQYTNNMIERML